LKDEIRRLKVERKVEIENINNLKKETDNLRHRYGVLKKKSDIVVVEGSSISSSKPVSIPV